MDPDRAPVRDRAQSARVVVEARARVNRGLAMTSGPRRAVLPLVRAAQRPLHLSGVRRHQAAGHGRRRWPRHGRGARARLSRASQCVRRAATRRSPSVGPEPALVVATPGAEPVAEGGYAAALLLDGWALLDRADLRASEETLRRWLAAAALVRPGGEGGRVVVMADSGHRAVQARSAGNRWGRLLRARRPPRAGVPPGDVLGRGDRGSGGGR